MKWELHPFKKNRISYKHKEKLHKIEYSNMTILIFTLKKNGTSYICEQLVYKAKVMSISITPVFLFVCLFYFVLFVSNMSCHPLIVGIIVHFKSKPLLNNSFLMLFDSCNPTRFNKNMHTKPMFWTSVFGEQVVPSLSQTTNISQVNINKWVHKSCSLFQSVDMLRWGRAT